MDAVEQWVRWAGAVAVCVTLAAEFGEGWEAYCRQVPAWIPRFWRW